MAFEFHFDDEALPERYELPPGQLGFPAEPFLSSRHDPFKGLPFPQEFPYSWHFSATPEQLPTLPQTDPELVARGEALLAEDMQPFLRLRERLLETDVVPADQPIAGERDVNVCKNPFDMTYLEKQALRQQGYAVSLVDGAVTEGGWIMKDSLTVRVSKDDAAAFQAVKSCLNSQDPATNPQRQLSQYLFEVTDNVGISPCRLEPGNVLYDHYHDTVKGRPDAEELLVRGFLTSHILRAVHQTVARRNREADETGPALPSIFPEAAERYAQLRDQGVKPLSAEELYGLAANVIRGVLKSNPEIPAPASRRRDFDDYGY